MRRWFKGLLMVCFLLLFAKSTSVLVPQMMDAKRAEDARQRAEDLVGLSGFDAEELSVEQKREGRQQEAGRTQEQILQEHEDGRRERLPVYRDAVTQVLNRMDMGKLKEENADVVGWIFIPDTPISYPILQGEDDSYYLNHTWEHTESASGSIFMDQMCSRDWTDDNTIIYGHRMKDRSMFGSLIYYQEQEYRDEHPYLYITDEEGCRVYEIFAAYEADTDDPVYQAGKLDGKKKQELMNRAMEKSVIHADLVPKLDEKIITLSTCTADNRKETRWILQGVLKGISPAGD